MRSYTHPVFNIEMPGWWRYQAQMPPGVLLYLVPALVALAIPQRWMRTYLLTTSLLAVWLTFGYGFTAAILGAVLLGWLMCQTGQLAVAKGPGWAKGTLIGGWVLANAVYFSMFWLPVDKLLFNATHLDILLLCGPAFLLVRVLGLFSDVCNGKDVGSLRLDRFALFLLYAPTFRLGPVTRYAEMNGEFDGCKSRLDSRLFWSGLFFVGLGLVQFELVEEVINKRLLKPYHDRTFFYLNGFSNAAPNLSYKDAIIGMYLIAFRFLLGFMGYSNIAKGLSLMMGIRLPQNFYRPYLVSNLQELWRRWHISMGEWLRDYVYIPLGGRNRRTVGTLVVFVYCMMWHQPAWNMLLFGLLHFGGSTVYHYWRSGVEILARRKAAVYQLARTVGIAEGPVGVVLGFLITFHFWCLALLVVVDRQGCGFGLIKRIFVDPVVLWVRG